MAENEKAPAAPEEAAAAKKASSWPPVIAMLVLMPAISYAMTQFVLIPKVRAVASETEAIAGAGKGAGKGEAKGGHGKEAEKGGHGKEAEKGGHGKEGADSKGKFNADFESVVVNLSGTMGTRYLKTSFTLLSTNPDFKKIVEENKKQLLDVATTVLGSRTMADLELPGAKNVVRNDLIANFNQVLNSDLVEQIFFSDFVVQ